MIGSASGCNSYIYPFVQIGDFSACHAVGCWLLTEDAIVKVSCGRLIFGIQLSTIRVDQTNLPERDKPFLID